MNLELYMQCSKIIKHSFADFAIETNALKLIKLVKDVCGQLFILVDKPTFIIFYYRILGSKRNA